MYFWPAVPFTSPMLMTSGEGVPKTGFHQRMLSAFVNNDTEPVKPPASGCAALVIVIADAVVEPLSSLVGDDIFRSSVSAFSHVMRPQGVIVYLLVILPEPTVEEIMISFLPVGVNGSAAVAT